MKVGKSPPENNPLESASWASFIQEEYTAVPEYTESLGR